MQHAAFQNAFIRAAENLASKNPSLNCYALVDCGQDKRYASQLSSLAADRTMPLFEGTQEHALSDHGPWLVYLGRPTDFDVRLIDWLSRQTVEKNAVLWLWSDQSPSTVATHLTHMLDWKVPDNHTILLRYYDPVVLAHAWSVLTDAQRHGFCGPISQWWYWEDEKLYGYFRPPTGGMASPELNQRQFAQLSLPYKKHYLPKLLEELRQGGARLPAPAEGKLVLERMGEAWDVALRLGIHSLPTLNEFVGFATVFPGFYNDPAIEQHLLAKPDQVDARTRDILAVMEWDFKQRKEAAA